MGIYRRHIAGFDPEKMSTNVLRLYNGAVGNTDGSKLYELTPCLDVDISTTGVNGRDPAYSLVDGSDWYPVLIGRDEDNEVGCVLTRGKGWSEITCPAGWHFIRKLPFGFVYNSAWGGIPDFHLSHWPKPHIRLTGSEAASPWVTMANGFSSTWTDLDLSGYIPDNARLVYILAEAKYLSGQAGSAYIRSIGSQGTGIIIGSAFPGSASGPTTVSVRVTSTRRIQYKCTGNCCLTVQVLGYDMTEPS